MGCNYAWKKDYYKLIPRHRSPRSVGDLGLFVFQKIQEAEFSLPRRQRLRRITYFLRSPIELRTTPPVLRYRAREGLRYVILLQDLLLGLAEKV